jgi:NTE family protein
MSATIQAQGNPRRIYVAFEGGGAKGIAHVGALKAINSLEHSGEVQVMGYSGTSAGAMVAALAAAGYTADELFDPMATTPRHILTVLSDRLNGPGANAGAADATSLFGKGGWARIVRYQKMVDGLSAYMTNLGLVVMGLVAAAFVAAFVYVIYAMVQNFANLAYPVVVAVGLAALALAAAAYAVFTVLGGLARVGAVRQMFHVALADKIKTGTQDPVRFGDFSTARKPVLDSGGRRRPSLKVVSTNISTEELELFSPEKRPRTAVADAVVASMCLPLIFRTHRIQDDHFVKGAYFFDGGLVSNLPAWVFDEERAMDQDALTIAVTTTDPPIADDDKKKQTTASNLTYSWLKPAARAAIFGGGALNVRAAGRLHNVAIETPIKLLDFDAKWIEFKEAVIEATAQASKRIEIDLIKVPGLLEQYCAYVAGTVGAAIATSHQNLGRPGRVRVAVASLESGFTASYRIAYTAGYAEADEGMLLPIESTFISEVFQQLHDKTLSDDDRRRVLLFDSAFTARAFRNQGFSPNVAAPAPAPENRLRARLAWQDRQWLYARAFDDGGGLVSLNEEDSPPRFIVLVDGDHTTVTAGNGGGLLTTVDTFVKAGAMEYLQPALSLMRR